ncbi:MAG: septal ring lytic transglycosylase RlpA family protein [Coleofasciculaceae cyanobacterium]
MNQRIWSGLTFTLLTTVVGTAGYAEPTKLVEQSHDGSPATTATLEEPTAVTAPAPALTEVQPTTVVKVGEFQSKEAIVQEEEVIAKIHTYELEGHQAATVYVRSIPVLTFLGSEPLTAEVTKMGEIAQSNNPVSSASQQKMTFQPQATEEIASAVSEANGFHHDPVWRATALAARLNQLERENVDAEAITVHWQADCECYSIKVSNEKLVHINENTILPDTTDNLAEDALQATNRLRRLIGNAPPVREIIGRPPVKKKTEISLGPVRFEIKGLASWYGPGFHGRRSASGERFNQNALTAAHRSLPFGTKVQVTNLRNGRSVVVRINDRGPYTGGRVIDLSAAAARVLGMVNAGVAPVSVEVLKTQ